MLIGAFFGAIHHFIIVCSHVTQLCVFSGDFISYQPQSETGLHCAFVLHLQNAVRSCDAVHAGTDGSVIFTTALPHEISTHNLPFLAICIYILDDFIVCIG